MAGYGYGYANFTSQPQQYSGGTFATQNTAGYGYASQPTAARVVQPGPGGYQTAGTNAFGAAGFTAGQGQTPVQAATTGGYGYFQRASEQNSSYAAAQKTSYATTQAFAYGTAKPATQYSANTPSYQKTSYSAAASSAPFSGYTVQRSTTNTASYNNNVPVAYNKPKLSTTVSSNKTISHQNAYEKVVFNAATTFLNQQAQTSKPSWQKSEKPTFRVQNQKSSWPSRPSKPQQLHYCEICKISCAGQLFQHYHRTPSKPQQLHYCDICKISCGGPLTYKEHLEGQKHKKKANSATSNTANMPPGTYKCDLCEVICTGRDAFAAHVKGTNHTKTLKLHQKLGKPIPEVKVPENTKKTVTVVKTATPKINFVGGTKLNSTGAEEKVEMKNDNQESEIPIEGEPIGESYVEDVKSDTGKVIGFKCTICDCRFNDVVAKTAHIKGRRHRMSYKKKVDPSIKVDAKGNHVRGPGGRWIRADERNRSSSSNPQELAWKQRQQQQIRWEQQLRLREDELRRWEHDEYMRRANEDRYWTRPDRNRMQELEFYEWERSEKHMEPRPLFGHPQTAPLQTPDDQLVMVRHNEIYPDEVELKQVQSTVASAEKALKKISDALEEVPNKPFVKMDLSESANPKPLMKVDSPVVSSPDTRQLKGVMRVGALAKGLLLQNQLHVELVVLCSEKPTATLLTRVGKMIPDKLREVAPCEKYNMSISVSDASITITSTTEPKCGVKILLTSPAMRDDDDDDAAKKAQKEPVPEDPKDVLDKEKCLQALAALRHAKWFQVSPSYDKGLPLYKKVKEMRNAFVNIETYEARASQLPSCVITIRILRDICARITPFKPLNPWAIELLCEKTLASNFQPMAVGEALRRVMEALSCGLLLPGGPGVMDPCEKDKTDAVGSMSSQEREDITAAAQHALRLIAFRQLHKVLGVEPLKPGRAAKRMSVETSDVPIKAQKKV